MTEQKGLVWADLDDDTKKKLIEEGVSRGLSTSAIAAGIGPAVSRNMISGFAFRNSIALNRSPKRVGQEGRSGKPSRSPASRGHRLSMTPAQAAEAAFPANWETQADYPDPRPTPLLELKERQCRTPLFRSLYQEGRVLAPSSMFFCGAQALPSKTMCARCRSFLVSAETDGGRPRAGKPIAELIEDILATAKRLDRLPPECERAAGRPAGRDCMSSPALDIATDHESLQPEADSESRNPNTAADFRQSLAGFNPELSPDPDQAATNTMQAGGRDQGDRPGGRKPPLISAREQPERMENAA